MGRCRQRRRNRAVGPPLGSATRRRPPRPRRSEPSFGARRVDRRHPYRRRHPYLRRHPCLRRHARPRRHPEHPRDSQHHRRPRRHRHRGHPALHDSAWSRPGGRRRPRQPRCRRPHPRRHPARSPCALHDGRHRASPLRRQPHRDRCPRRRHRRASPQRRRHSRRLPPPARSRCAQRSRGPLPRCVPTSSGRPDRPHHSPALPPLPPPPRRRRRPDARRSCGVRSRRWRRVPLPVPQRTLAFQVTHT
jgi:hypothetical protein